MPLARAITAHCKQEAERKGSQSHRAEKTTSEDYSYWLQEAYPQRSDRQRYLRELIEGKPISHANLRLAHLLLDPEIANLVVTTNFDDFLSRALTLFGKSHVVCDHPNTTERIDPERQDVQIIHVHGSYWFYDCCNLEGEIDLRAKYSAQRNQTMASLLDRILANRSPIVVGYSGWENDVIMQALKRRLNSSLPYNLYWFLHKRPKADEKPLPDWLWNHSDVKFVAPREIQVASVATNPLASLEKVDELKASRLAAPQVFSAMIQSLELESPLLTQDPLQHFKEHLECSLPQDEGEQQDPYSFQSVIAQVERAKDKEQKQQPDLLEPIRNALRKAQYRKTIQLARKISFDSLEDRQRLELIFILWNAASSLFDDSAEELLAYQLIVDVYDALFPTLQETALDEVATALVYQGFVLDRLNRLEEAIIVFDNLIMRFSSSSKPALQEPIASALFGKGFVLDKLNRSEEAIIVFDNLIMRFSNGSELALQRRVAAALGSKGIALDHLNRLEEVIAVYDNLINRFSSSSDLTLQKQVLSALFGKGIASGKLHRSEEAITVFENLIKRFGNNTEDAFKELVANAFLGKAIALTDLVRLEEAIAVYDNLIECFAASTENALQKCVEIARAQKTKTLNILNCAEEASGDIDGDR